VSKTRNEWWEIFNKADLGDGSVRLTYGTLKEFEMALERDLNLAVTLALEKAAAVLKSKWSDYDWWTDDILYPLLALRSVEGVKMLAEHDKELLKDKEYWLDYWRKKYDELAANNARVAAEARLEGQIEEAAWAYDAITNYWNERNYLDVLFSSIADIYLKRLTALRAAAKASTPKVVTEEFCPSCGDPLPHSEGHCKAGAP
jgi:hypothetical protein